MPDLTENSPAPRQLFLTVAIATYNRADLLLRAVDSVFEAPCPAGLNFQVLVVANNCTDHTAQVLERCRQRYSGRFTGVDEPRQGNSWARNKAVQCCDTELFAFIDDDERISSTWLNAVYEAFQDDTLDFIGGPCVPDFSAPPPAWLPQRYPAVIGAVDFGPCIQPYGARFPGILQSGNCVLRRTCYDKAGLYDTALGIQGTRLGSCEDEDFYYRLVRTGARGHYIPALSIHHYVPRERMTKRYHRRWVWRQAASWLVVLGRDPAHSQRCLFGIPFFLYSRAVDGLLGMLLGAFSKRPPAAVFSGQLDLIRLFALLNARARRAVSG